MFYQNFFHPFVITKGVRALAPRLHPCASGTTFNLVRARDTVEQICLHYSVIIMSLIIIKQTQRMITCTFHASVNPSEREDNGAFCLCWLWGEKNAGKKRFCTTFVYTNTSAQCCWHICIFFCCFPAGCIVIQTCWGETKSCGLINKINELIIIYAMCQIMFRPHSITHAALQHQQRRKNVFASLRFAAG
jgi:hypothetical protein